MPGIPRSGTAGSAEPHLRLRASGVEPDPGRAATAYATDRTATSYAQTDRALTAMKKDPDFAFLNEVASVPLQQTLRHQHKAFTAFFAKRARYPRFKSRHARQCAHYTRSAFTMRGGVLRLAKTGGPLLFCGRGQTWTSPALTPPW